MSMMTDIGKVKSSVKVYHEYDDGHWEGEIECELSIMSMMTDIGKVKSSVKVYHEYNDEHWEGEIECECLS
ncbi:hypothetical protein [Virgibacillus halodenitrificans]|uniref:hypothetical protein n=1 Tax=Virgibacillus halodenitrificans TaxID=1482 RepID=UPI000761014A